MNDQNFDNDGDALPESTPDNATPEHAATETRPLGFWVRTIDGLLGRELANALQSEGVTHREWMLLTALAGDTGSSWLADRLARRPKRLRGLEKRGWAEEQGDGTWTITAEGRAAKERVGHAVDGIRARVAESVAPEDLATTLASLETIARELGWDGSAPHPRSGRGFRPGFGPGTERGFGPGRPGFGPGHAPGFGPGFRAGFGPGFDPRRGWVEGSEDADGCHHHGHSSREFAHHGHGHADPGGFGGDSGLDESHRPAHRRPHTHDARADERAYERGFEAGFARATAARGA